MNKQDKINAIYNTITPNNEGVTGWATVILIGDVLAHFTKKWKYEDPIFTYNQYSLIVQVWKKRELAIEEQNEKCIDYIFNFLSK